MYKIKKIFEICYAHRLHGYPGKCGNIHGHTAKIEVTCTTDRLLANGISIDFKDLSKRVGDWLDESLDHRLILAENDPAAEEIRSTGEDVKLIDSPPSAENLARMIFNAVKEMGYPVTKVTFWESPTSAVKYKS